MKINAPSFTQKAGLFLCRLGEERSDEAIHYLLMRKVDCFKILRIFRKDGVCWTDENHQRHGEERSDEAIHYLLMRKVDCFKILRIFRKDGVCWTDENHQRHGEERSDEAIHLLRTNRDGAAVLRTARKGGAFLYKIARYLMKNV